jgi:hypothetical protein
LDIFMWATQNAALLLVAVTVLVPLGGGIIALVRYVDLRSKALERERFTDYHSLIRDLVQSPSGEVMRLDRQIAVIFELRRFPAYFEVTSRILNGLRVSWRDADSRLLEEIDLAIQYVDAHDASRLRRAAAILWSGFRRPLPRAGPARGSDTLERRGNPSSNAGPLANRVHAESGEPPKAEPPHRDA